MCWIASEALIEMNRGRMNGFLDWREIELQNDWGVREKSDAMGQRWDDGAAMWDERWKRDQAFTKRQADALAFEPDDTVLDIGCGTGPLTVHVAPRVKRMVAFDFGQRMLERLRANCAERGIDNVETLQGNWYDMEPGTGLPICDVAITRWSPAQGDILKFSRCARRWCWSVSSVESKFAEGGAQPAGMYWCRSTVDESLNMTPRPCARKYGLNVHFNLLYDHGANPTVSYLVDEKRTEAATREELLEEVLGKPPADLPDGAREGALAMIGRDISQTDDGLWVHHRKHTIAIMGWDPNEIVY